MDQNISVLHLLPHCGGGVGNVLRTLLKSEYREDTHPEYSIASLEHLDEATRCHCNKLGIPWFDSLAINGGYEKISNLVNKADIVIVHWWNHPFLMRLLFQGLPSCRMLLWSHVNGFSVPQSFFSELFELPDRFIFATKASLQSQVINDLPEYFRQKLCVIRSCAGIPAGADKPCDKDDPFRFGYVGTVEPAKMHPDFLKMCASAEIPTPCIVAGGPSHDALVSKAKHLNVQNKFDILGPVDDPTPIFRSLHAFAYPLNSGHYGTGEQVLIEAMAYGAVPVVLANPPETALIRHEETGLITNTTEEFSKALRFLADNPAKRKRLADAGQKFVFEKCDIKISVNKFNALYEEILSFSKHPRRLKLPSYDSVADGSPFHLFLTSCGSSETRDFFKNNFSKDVSCSLSPEFMSKTRGTPWHYLSLLGYDPNLELICKTSNDKTGATS